MFAVAVLLDPPSPQDKAVCSGRGHRVQGLATEVVRRSELRAAELGCSHTYACVTGGHIALYRAIKLELQTNVHMKVRNHGDVPYLTRAFSWLKAATSAFTLKHYKDTMQNRNFPG